MTAAIEYKIDPIALNREMEDPPFEFRGGAGTGRVIDLQGNVLLESSADIGIFGAVVSPDRKKVLVRGGDGKSLILEPSKNQKIVPPFKPPGSNSFPFDWYWVSANLLFGISGVERTFHEGSHMDGESNIAQTKFYTFDLLTGQLFEVVMPRAVTQSVVKVVDVMSDGHIHLLQDDLDEGVRQDLGWFKIAE
ncbi:MAG: hypothetical protein KDN22_20245 [Verrucomicrobiae bacterium]|nr:hypothetical protein [Verrucomicrobiae bacterium]